MIVFIVCCQKLPSITVFYPAKYLQDLIKIVLEKFGKFKYFSYLCIVNERQTEESENLEKSRKNENPNAL